MPPYDLNLKILQRYNHKGWVYSTNVPEGGTTLGDFIQLYAKCTLEKTGP